LRVRNGKGPDQIDLLNEVERSILDRMITDRIGISGVSSSKLYPSILTVFNRFLMSEVLSSPRCQDHDRIHIKDFIALATRLRNAEAAVVHMLVEHCGDLDVVAGVGK
jgi:hypothetical protein